MLPSSLQFQNPEPKRLASVDMGLWRKERCFPFLLSLNDTEVGMDLLPRKHETVDSVNK